MKQALLIIFFLLSSCAAIEKDPGFKEISKEVLDRTGKEVYWNEGTAADKTVRDKITLMLSTSVTSAVAIQIALLNNNHLQATYEELNIAQSDLVEAGLLTNPIFDAEVRIHKGGKTGLELAVVQNFIDLVFLRLRKAAAEAAFQSSKLKVIKSVVDLASDVEREFYNYQAAEAKLNLQKHILSASAASFQLAQNLRIAGNITELSAASESAFYEESKIELRKSEVHVLKSREKLNGLMGLWGNDTDWKSTSELDSPKKEDIESADLERKALKRSLDLGIIKWELNEAANNLGIAEPWGVFNDAGLGATGEREAESGEWGVGPAFSIPIPIFNQGQPGIARASAVLKAKHENYKGSAINLRASVRAEIESLLALKDEANYYKKVLIPLRKKIVHENQLQYNAMQLGAFELFKAKKDEIEAENQYIETLKDYWITNANLNQILNGSLNLNEGM